MKEKKMENELLRKYFSQSNRDEVTEYDNEIKAEADLCHECCSCCRICWISS